ncbi:MAG: UDP-N-acetyl-D-mannosamine dehydrogenase [Lewinellaceae bacterium]|nr:UDP-N-acetyl-D-mannosamine dehydrogenase [Lewinellaceae bacterium]
MMGLGYIGLPTAALMAKKKIKVLGVDINPAVVETVNRGEIHIVEPELDGLVHHVIEKGYLRASTQPAAADVFLIAVPTPFQENHVPDLRFVEAATRMVIPLLQPGNLFIIESTSPVGTTEKMAALVYQERPELQGHLYVAYCPERVLPGNVIYELEHNDRVIGGIDEASAQQALAFYRQFVKAELHPTNARTAEMCKLVENAFRDTNIAFANELSMICDRAGINVWELIRLANRHPRVNILRPGAGVGGHCIAVDPWFIVADFPEEAQIIRKAREINTYKTEWAIEKVSNAILRLHQTLQRRARVAIMGLAFKPDIDDLRESPALYIAQRLLAAGEADFLVAEPHVQQLAGFTLVPYPEAYAQADLVVFLVAHKQFRLLPAQPDKQVLDFCGVRDTQ